MGGDWRDKAGGLMCVGHSAAALGDKTRALLDAGVCGVVLRAAAFRDASLTAQLIHTIKHYAGRPLFVAVDQDSAEALPDGSGFSSLPSAQKLGQSGDVELARHVGEVWGRELRAVGVDMTLGPCVDVNTAGAPCPSDCRLGSDAELVARLSAALIEGQQSEGVAACAKHFPGHGEICRDVGKDLPRVPYGIARLEEVELLPFRAAVGARVAGMMVGHILLEALDERAPASLSRAIVFGLLRQKLAYRGLLMIDDVDNRALAQGYDRQMIARLGVASGADCFVCTRRPESAFELIDAIERGVALGEILPERIESARRRIAPLLHRYVRDPGPAPDLSALGHATSESLLVGLALDPRINPAPHVSPGPLTANKKQHQH